MKLNNFSEFIKYFITKQKKYFIILLILHLAWALDQTLLPLAFKLFLDILTNFTGNKAEIWTKIAVPLAFGGGLWIMIEIMYRTYDYISTTVFPKFQSDIRLYMIKYLQRHSYGFFSNNFSGSLSNKINDMASEASLILESIIVFFIPTILAMIIGGFIFASFHPYFAFILFIWFFVHIGISLFYAKKCNEYSYTHSKSRSHLTGRVVDSFTNIFAIKGFARGANEMAELGKYQIDEKNKNIKLNRLLFKIRLLQGSFCFLMMGILVVWAIVTNWQKNIITAPEAVYIFYTSWGLTMMSFFSGWQIAIFFKSLGICRQAFKIISLPHEIKEIENAKPLKIRKTDIIYENVTFYHEENKNLFKNSNLIIKAGTKIGLVGESGGGKTSLINLLMRFHDLESGRILIDNQDISRVQLDSLRKNITLIPQDPTLFHRTIYENISYGKDNVTKKEVIEASKKAYCHEFISELKDGYDTYVGERGVKLSGGQRQRISIARAILKDAPILILDEATSALDSKTEKYIQDSLSLLMKDKNKTVIAIAHRLSTLQNMDRIIVLDKGKIAEEGTHSELLDKNNSLYKKLWELQSI